jgi:16S rRNA C967 or C1407 C5-methylase (RsmB/RsmF family)
MLPLDFIEKIKQLLPNEWETLVAAIDTPPIVSIRKNPKKIRPSIIPIPL